jgi:hypothetical protein
MYAVLGLSGMSRGMLEHCRRRLATAARVHLRTVLTHACAGGVCFTSNCHARCVSPVCVCVHACVCVCVRARMFEQTQQLCLCHTVAARLYTCALPDAQSVWDILFCCISSNGVCFIQSRAFRLLQDCSLGARLMRPFFRVVACGCTPFAPLVQRWCARARRHMCMCRDCGIAGSICYYHQHQGTGLQVL